jgi:hypothetical protein
MPPKMRFYMPDWDDKVDPGYNFQTDKFSAAHEANPRSDYYMWELFGVENVPFDGVLVSKLQIDSNDRKAREVAAHGVKAYLRLPPEFPVLGDCGAFGYINLDKPPVTTPEILQYYQATGVDFAVSIDHLIVKSVRVLDREGKATKETRELSRAEKEERIAITTQNAIDFWNEWDQNPSYRDAFRPIAGVQGETPEDYAQCLTDILAGASYDYVAVGSIVRRPTKEIVKILKAIYPLVEKYALEVHVFGVFRLDAIPEFYRWGVRSFDSASRLRKSWLSNHENYYFHRRSYTGLRVPQPEASTKTRRLVEQDPEAYLQLFQTLQEKCLGKIREFDATPQDVPVEEVIETLTEYTRYFAPDLKLIHWYRETLEERPWQQCTCPICREIGPEVIIFRGNNRNRRRGFHNVWVEYEELQKILADLEDQSRPARKKKGQITDFMN